MYILHVYFKYLILCTCAHACKVPESNFKLIGRCIRILLLL